MVRPVLSHLTGRLGSNVDPLAAWVADTTKLCTADPGFCRQHWWGTALGTRCMLDLVERARPRDQARILEQRSGLGSTWMTALPSPTSGAIFSTEEYRMGLKWWLGAPLIVQTAARCPGCRQQVYPEGDVV